MHTLADVGLTTREACYNTVRNVTACPLGRRRGATKFSTSTPTRRKWRIAFLRKELTDNLPRKFKIAFRRLPRTDCIAGAINDIGLRAVVRDGQRGFRMMVGGGLGPLPTEAQLLDEFVPEERLVNKCEAVIRVFSQYGNRQQQEQGAAKVCDARARLRVAEGARSRKNTQDILANGGIAMAGDGAGRFRWISVHTAAARARARCCRWSNQRHRATPEYERWLGPTCVEQKQTGYAVVTVRVDQGNLTERADARRWPRSRGMAGDGLCGWPSIRTCCWPLSRLGGCRGSTRHSGNRIWATQGLRRSTTSPPARELIAATWR